MSRTYLRAAGLTGVGLEAAGLSRESKARALFDSTAVPKKHFAVLVQPTSRARWKLLVLEQIKAQPRCWRASQDGLVEPSFNLFNFSGICRRYLESNGYSLRSGGQCSSFQRLEAPMPPIAPPPLPTPQAQRRRTTHRRITRLASSAPIRLQVIPYRR